MKRLEDVLIRLDADLRKLRCRWALVGGLAVSIRARPRTTQDVDVAIAVTSDQEAERLVATLRGFGYDIFAILEQKVTSRMATVRLLPPGDLRNPLSESADDQTLTDLLFASSGIEPEVVAHAELLTVFPGLRVPVATTGHLLALKVLSEQENRPQDRMDAMALIEYNGEGLRPSVFDYWLGVILANDPELACEWILTRLREEQIPCHLGSNDPFTHAVQSLALDQRRAILEALADERHAHILIRATVGRDLDIYRHLLGLERLRRHHLEPLHGVPDAPWTEMARLALRTGYPAEEIAWASFHPPHFIAGSGIDYWDEWERGFAVLEEDPRPDVQEIARHGSQIAHTHLKRANEQERELELHGV